MTFLRETAWLATGTPASLVGHADGPLTRLRTRRHRRMHARGDRPIRICLLELHTTGLLFGARQAWFVNERSRLCSAAVNESPASADVVWVYSQDPLEDAVRARLEEVLDGVPASTPVLNRPGHHDAYHRDDAFPRLAAAGVRVPRHTFDEQDVGRAEVVYKEQGEQGSDKFRATYQGRIPGYRAFGLEDGGAADGWVRRYRAWHLAGAVHPEQAILAPHWNATLGSVVSVERTFTMTPHEVEQVRLVGLTLGLDFFAVDYLRRRCDGLPVFVDVNVYPTPVEAWTQGLAGKGTWHLWDSGRRAGLPPPHGRDPWRVFDAAMARLVGLPGADGADGPDLFPAQEWAGASTAADR